jgi:hypothetical protein
MSSNKRFKKSTERLHALQNSRIVPDASSGNSTLVLRDFRLPAQRQELLLWADEYAQAGNRTIEEIARQNEPWVIAHRHFNK